MIVRYVRLTVVAMPVDHVSELILVDADDKEVGTASKLTVHNDGLLHRAISIWIFNTNGDTLLQRRHQGKYHSPGLWSNTCCTHPVKGQSTVEAARARLTFEMGISVELKFIFSFIYKAHFDNGLIEHEFDHVFVGCFDGEPIPESSEVMEFQWISQDDLTRELDAFPQRYTFWLKEMWQPSLRQQLSGAFI